MIFKSELEPGAELCYFRWVYDIYETEFWKSIALLDR